MTIEEFTKIADQMKSGTVSKRLIFICSNSISQLEKIITNIEILQHDLVNIKSTEISEIINPQHYLEANLKNACKEYEGKRNEPSVLIIKNAILLVRYGCDMSAIHRYGISPRSAVILMMPKDVHRYMPPKTDGWIKKNTKELIKLMAKQLGIPNCIIDA